MKKVDIKDQVAESILCAELENRQIKYVVRKFTDSAYGGIYELTNGYGFVEVNDEDEKIAIEILESIGTSSTDIDQTFKSKKGRKFGIKNMVIFSLLTMSIILVFISIDIKRKYDLMTIDELYDFEWNSHGTILEFHWKTNKKIALAKYDENRNGLFEKGNEYDKDGNRISDFISTHDNGIYDRQISYSKNGNIISESFYDDANILIKHIDYYTGDKSIIWTSTVGSGYMNKLRIIGNNKTVDKDINELFD